MSKKNKDIQISEKEVVVPYENKKRQAVELWLGKRKIGTIIPIEHSIDIVVEGSQTVLKAKYFDEAEELLLREWNLHQQ